MSQIHPGVTPQEMLELHQEPEQQLTSLFYSDGSEFLCNEQKLEDPEEVCSAAAMALAFQACKCVCRCILQQPHLF